MLRKLSAVFVYHLPQEVKQQMGPGFVQWQQRCCFNVISVFSCAWLALQSRPCCQTAGIPCLGRWCAADSGIASIAGEVATCPPLSDLFEVTKPDIKGYREWAALMNHRFHDFFTFVMTLSWQRHQSFWVQNQKEDLRQLFDCVTRSHTPLNQGLTLLTCGRYCPPPFILACLALPHGKCQQLGA